jgi:hypothetical protein
MSETLPDFPVTSDVLALLRESLDGSYTVDEEGNHVLEGAEFSTTQYLDFLSGHDPSDYTVVDTKEFGDSRLEIREYNSPQYSLQDVIRALIIEIERLRNDG